MPSASAARIGKSLDVRADGAVICKCPTTHRGRCNKLVATKDGELRCDNGHTYEIAAVLCEALNRPDANWKILIQCMPAAYGVRPLIQRLASPEFLAATNDSQWHDFLINRLDIFTEILARADIYEPECAKALRDYWERKLPTFWPDIGQYLAARKQNHPTAYFRFREKALLAFRRWGCHDPLRYNAWSELSLEAMRYLGKSRFELLHEHNIAESARLFSDNQRYPTPALLYFAGSGYKDVPVFKAMPDPYWTYPDWGIDTQVRLQLQPDKSSGKMVRLHVTVGDQQRQHNLDKAVESTVSSESRSIQYLGHNGKFTAVIPSTQDIDFDDPKFHLDVVRDFVSAVFLRMETLTQP